jgi:hypothetical protein
MIFAMLVKTKAIYSRPTPAKHGQAGSILGPEIPA